MVAHLAAMVSVSSAESVVRVGIGTFAGFGSLIIVNDAGVFPIFVPDVDLAGGYDGGGAIDIDMLVDPEMVVQI